MEGSPSTVAPRTTSRPTPDGTYVPRTVVASRSETHSAGPVGIDSSYLGDPPPSQWKKPEEGHTFMSRRPNLDGESTELHSPHTDGRGTTRDGVGHVILGSVPLASVSFVVGVGDEPPVTVVTVTLEVSIKLYKVGPGPGARRTL